MNNTINIKKKLKERLLEIPFGSRAYREKIILAKDLSIGIKDIEILLNELCDRDILEEQVQYICKKCHDVTIIDKNLLKDLVDENEDNCFECDNCGEFINPNTDITGYLFYDIKNEQALIEFE